MSEEPQVDVHIPELSGGLPVSVNRPVILIMHRMTGKSLLTAMLLALEAEAATAAVVDPGAAQGPRRGEITGYWEDEAREISLNQWERLQRLAVPSVTRLPRKPEKNEPWYRQHAGGRGKRWGSPDKR